MEAHLTPPRPLLASIDASIDTTDRMRWLTIAGIAGLLAAGLLAVIGGFPIDMPMPEHQFGWVAPTCGLTRGSTAIARGDLAVAWHYNPVAFLVMALGAAAVVRSIIGLATRRWLNITGRIGPLTWPVLAALFVAWTLYQQTNAEFIINSRL